MVRWRNAAAQPGGAPNPWESVLKIQMSASDKIACRRPYNAYKGSVMYATVAVGPRTARIAMNNRGTKDRLITALTGNRKPAAY
jgi:hypothetical protein